MKKEIKDLIEAYAKVYEDFEYFQNQDKQLLPGGDQKTGVIAEYYAKCYIEHDTKNSDVSYAKPGDSCDIIYTNANGEKIKVQVKGVSAHSKTRIIAPLNLKINEKGERPFDLLYLIDLSKDFVPIAFYINSYDDIIKRTIKSKERIVGSTMMDKSNPQKKGSVFYDFGTCLVEDMLNALKTEQD